MTISVRRRARLVIMVKVPRPGRVKTRLGREIGMTAAAWWLRHRLRHMARVLRDRRWDTLLAVSPDAEGLTTGALPGGLPRVPQGRGDLGDRMTLLFRKLPPGPVVIVGADIPAITRAHIARAFGRLGSHEAVFGPADDGGFWLVGLKRTTPPPRKIFDGVRWSSAHALNDCLGNLDGRRVALIDTLADVDTAADLASARGRW